MKIASTISKSVIQQKAIPLALEKSGVGMKYLVKLLLKTIWARKVPGLRSVWWHFYRKVRASISGNVEVNMHGFKAMQPIGYTYPFTSRLYSTFNNPLIEIVYQTYKQQNRKIHVVDIGAAIGDTVFLLKANCPDMVERFYCVDGDEEFYEYLTKNLSQYKDVKTFHHILSDSTQRVSSLVRIHSGTASAQGLQKSDAIPFDLLYTQDEIKHVDVLKVDVDGFDGKVLSGAKNVLVNEKPAVIFEWHPKLYQNAGSDFLQPFQVLNDAGYGSFVWFSKTGSFSHFSLGFDEAYLRQFAEICINNSTDDDWHYDIVGLHMDSQLSILEFANSDYSRAKKSPY